MCSRGQSADIHAPDKPMDMHPLTRVEPAFTSAKFHPCG